jgi:proteasome lid subunit RPN8/RPN11
VTDTVSILSNLLSEGEELERCGFVLTDGEVVEVNNTHPEPEKGFVIPAASFRKYEDRIVATWHTHPKANANLSQEDYKGFSQWPQLRHYIIGVDGVRAFEVTDGLVVKVSL